MDTNKKIEFIKTTSVKLENGDVEEAYPSESYIPVIHTQDENANGTTDDQLYIGNDRITDKFNIGDSSFNTPTRKVGGLDASTIGTLKDKTMSEILMDILRPDVVEPSISSVANVNISYSGSTLIEVGTTLPTEANITNTVLKGSWSDGTPYAGENEPIVLTMNPDSWGEQSVEGKNTISGSVVFEAGGIPVDNFGTEYPAKQYQGGTKNSNVITLTSVYPIYINDGNDITIMNKHLVNYIDGVELTVTIPAEVETPSPMKFTVYVPEEFTRFVVKKYNPLTNQYDIDVPMVYVSGDTNMYIRKDNTYTNTTSTQYKINLKL